MKDLLAEGIEELLDWGQDADTVNAHLNKHLEPQGLYARWASGRQINVFKEEDDSLVGTFQVQVTISTV